MFDQSTFFQSFIPIIRAMPTTLILTVASIALALTGGIILSLLLTCPLKIIRTIFKIVASFLKGIPILVFLYVFNTSIDGVMAKLYSLFNLTYSNRNTPTLQFAIFALSLSYTPYLADMIISAYNAVPRGQSEACTAFGFTKGQAMLHIIIPQMIVVAIPNFGNHFVNLLKATSLTCMVTIMEMMGTARNFATMNQKFLEAYTACALIYWIVFELFEQFFGFIERRSGRYLQPGALKVRART
ncbi:MAG: amino acid ABC transporter permease [Lachnospiraceae bacterium]|nr:amino acid ABC transporter permease [Lachnospiraceae bacterium]